MATSSQNCAQPWTHAYRRAPVSSTHVGAIADRVMKVCREAGYPIPRVEGLPLCDWVLLDASDAIVHIFRPDIRQFYNLEKMWSADRPGEVQKS